ncbi:MULTISPECIES: class I SAM-dependent methyltransferase [unclassified Bacillus (in: firmicutes)]|uniref:class I SAM-dependent methyltransferase n=1 Tax=unclassified Bacillus (in: firmicutes) TaxID=185979 RepID=UPI000BEFDAC0|nr:MULTISPECIES: class I SAM-dependent methyltransferase [unclassified Bacillus (in: firmicutes)]PEJ47411.1 16S rRNA methyltransferase [Bacillus sp. AFS002410]PEL08265.1 16S rRNA methyltransferase [Bacillus sp. AFS017336]
MADHYFTNQPNSKTDKKVFSFTLRGNDLRFQSDSGVFSRNEVDFGSRVLIDSFEFPEIEGNILDVGCGYGPIGLSIAKDDAGRMVEMIDVNLRAIELAKDNANVNKIENVKIYESSIYENVTGEYAAILTNPPIRAGKAVVHEILAGAHEKILPGGELWVVIQKKQGAPSALELLKGIFDEVEVVKKDKGYYIIKSKKD